MKAAVAKTLITLLAVALVALGMLFPTRTADDGDVVIYDAFLYRKAVVGTGEGSRTFYYWGLNQRPDADTIRQDYVSRTALD